jgi:hypothetical protein
MLAQAFCLNFCVTAALAVKYFGFYSANLTQNARYSNLYQADTLADAVAAKALNQESLLSVYDTFFQRVADALVLQPNYAADWEAMAAVAAPYLANGTILGFNLGDELVWNCLAPTNLTIVADTVRASFPRGQAVIWYKCVRYGRKGAPAVPA